MDGGSRNRRLRDERAGRSKQKPNFLSFVCNPFWVTSKTNDYGHYSICDETQPVVMSHEYYLHVEFLPYLLILLNVIFLLHVTWKADCNCIWVEFGIELKRTTLPPSFTFSCSLFLSLSLFSLSRAARSAVRDLSLARLMRASVFLIFP